jgi:hypothetical protein
VAFLLDGVKIALASLSCRVNLATAKQGYRLAQYGALAPVNVGTFLPCYHESINRMWKKEAMRLLGAARQKQPTPSFQQET